LKHFMYRHLSLVIAALLFIFPDIAHSIDRVKVIILPFDIHASKDLSTLQNEILNVIKTYIKEEGAFIVTPESVPAMMLFKTFQRYDDIRKFGLKNGADDVVWGSLTLIGQRFSLDAKLVESFGESECQ